MSIDRYDNRTDFAGRGGGYPPRRSLGGMNGNGNNGGGMVERIPPQNIEAEIAVLGAMLLGDRTAIERATEVLQKDDFYRDAHGHIYETMVLLVEKDEPVDLVTMKDELNRRGLLEGVGGVGYLMNLVDSVATSANVSYHAAIVAEKATLRRLITTAGEIAGMAYGEVDEIAAIIDEAERKVFEIANRRVSKAFTPLRPLLNDAFEKIDMAYHDRGSVTGLDTGIHDLNEMTSGFQDGDLVIIAARPSMGKTSLAMGIAAHAAIYNAKTVAVFSLEMGKDQLVQRMICSEAKVDAHRLRTGHLRDEDWTRISGAVQKLWDAPMFIDDTTNMGPLEMRAKCRRLNAEHGLDLVVVDYLQLMSGSKTAGNRNEEITEISRGLKGIAREMQVPVIALAQLSRAVERREDKRPMLSDLRDSGSIEAEADLVSFIYRPSYYARKEDFADKGDGGGDDNAGPPPSDYDGEEAEVIIGKHRNGPTGTVKVSFLPKFARFDNLAYRPDEGF